MSPGSRRLLNVILRERAHSQEDSFAVGKMTNVAFLLFVAVRYALGTPVPQLMNVNIATS